MRTRPFHTSSPFPPVHPGVHARARAGGGLPVPDRIRTLLLFLAERRLQSVPSVSGDPPVQLPGSSGTSSGAAVAVL